CLADTSFKTALNKSAERTLLWTSAVSLSAASTTTQEDGRGERPNGRGDLRSRPLSDGDICRGTCDGHGGVCVLVWGRRPLAAHPHADADRDIDHRLRSRGAGRLGLEVAARAAMESALAVPAWRGVGSPFGRRGSRMGPA